MDMILDPYKSRLYKVSIEYMNSQNGVRMKSWWPSKFDAFLRSESNPSKMCQIQSLCYFAPKCRGGLVGDIGNTWNWSPINFFGPPYLPCVFSTILIHLCISENDNKHISWCNINSSNESNTIMLKTGFTFDQKFPMWFYPSSNVINGNQSKVNQ